MEVGFFFWPYNPGLVENLADRADRYGYDMIGIADTPGNAMDPWVSAALAARVTKKARVALCVTNIVTRDAAVSAAAIASIDQIIEGRAVPASVRATVNEEPRPQQFTAKEPGGRHLHQDVAAGEAATLKEATAHLPWVAKPQRCFAASHPLGLAAAGRTADGVFLNFGLGKDNIVQSEAIVAKGISERPVRWRCRDMANRGVDCALMTLPVTRSGRCWRSWRDMSSATKILKRVGSPNIFASRSWNCAGATAPGQAMRTSDWCASSACLIIFRGVCRSAARRNNV